MHQGFLDTSLSKAAPASVTPGPASVLKNPHPPAAVPESFSGREVTEFSSSEVGETNGRADDNDHAANIAFENNYTDFQQINRDLVDIHKRGDGAFLAMNVLLATVYSETLQDQGDLSMMLASLLQLNADMDSQIAKYQDFLDSSPEST